MFGWVISILWTILKNNPNMILSKKTLCQVLRKGHPLFLLFFYIVKRGYFNMFSDTVRWHEKVLELFFFLKIRGLGEKSYLFFLYQSKINIYYSYSIIYVSKVKIIYYAFTNLHHLFPHKSTLNLRGWGVMNIY